jgi:outer membrane protein assembly factor BamD (BamD/ComL family)
MAKQNLWPDTCSLFLRFTCIFLCISATGLPAYAIPQSDPQSELTDLYTQAVQDYTQNHLSDALKKFQKVSGAHAQESEEYIRKIKTYIDDMGLAKGIVDRSADERDVGSLEFAIQKYQEALKIKPDGPWQPAQQLEKARALKAQVEQSETTRKKVMDVDFCNKALAASQEHHYREAASYSCPLANDDPGYSCGGDEAVHMCDQMTELGKSEQASDPGVSSTVRTPTVSNALEKAEASYNKNDFQRARSQFQSVPGEFKSAANEYLAKISRYQEAMTQGAKMLRDSNFEEARASFRAAAGIKPDGPGDPQNQIMLVDLAQGVEQFYSGNYLAATHHLDSYTKANPDKRPLAYFYLGASKLARFYLTGAEDDGLRSAALGDLKFAKQNGFMPAGQDISPKIMQAYKDLAF